MRDSGKKGSRTIETPRKEDKRIYGWVDTRSIFTYSLTPTLRQAYLLL